eukprot:CAMPEP_0172434546 /NCGR_PEP_ID=MMETSP1064-20121228/70694_1 /TAXON_ID=202472 /ORGANISM="Aulacoseira subarctica , Strain CCAP 1002/5" /LENGTH=100 /DNA_ID=CAMNT_0013182779 /DNA_START=491 /DNA_END=789 /DNA_ORIENTATION=+
MGYRVTTYGPSDVIFGVVENATIIMNLEAIGAYGVITQSGKVRSKGKKSVKRNVEEKEVGEDEEEETMTSVRFRFQGVQSVCTYIRVAYYACHITVTSLS